VSCAATGIEYELPSTRKSDHFRRMTLSEWMHQLRDDAAYAFRILVKSPSFSGVALLTLALGTGATTAIFSVVRAVVLRPLPIAGVEQTVRIYETNPSTNSFATSEANFLDFRDRTHSFSAMGAFTPRRLSLVGRGDPVQLTGVAAAAGYFGVIAAKPVLGTVYGPDNDKRGSDTRVIVLSEGIWRSVFGSDRSVVGSTLNLDGDGYRVVGVIPSTDSYLPADFWIPLAASLDSPRGNHPLFAVGRLKNGVTIEQAEADIKAVAAQLSVLYPKSNGEWGATRAARRVDPGAQFAEADADVARCSVFRSAARVCERWQLAARARHRAPARTVRARRVRREPAASRPTTVDGKRRPRAGGISARTRACGGNGSAVAAL
jgi:hypothetical protein